MCKPYFKKPNYTDLKKFKYSRNLRKYFKVNEIVRNICSVYLFLHRFLNCNHHQISLNIIFTEKGLETTEMADIRGIRELPSGRRPPKSISRHALDIDNEILYTVSDQVRHCRQIRNARRRSALHYSQSQSGSHHIASMEELRQGSEHTRINSQILYAAHSRPNRRTVPDVSVLIHKALLVQKNIFKYIYFYFYFSYDFELFDYSYETFANMVTEPPTVLVN